jgi:hypothetical protein
MTAVLHVIGWWVLLNCTAAPCLVWFVFRNRRRAREARARWVALHPPLHQMPIQFSGIGDETARNQSTKNRKRNRSPAANRRAFQNQGTAAETAESAKCIPDIIHRSNRRKVARDRP